MIRLMQKLATDWAVRCFGREHVLNHAARGLRHIEEAVELGQALGCSKEDVIKVIDIVYSRPVGSLSREVGGSILTLMVLCESHMLDLEICAQMELQRVLNKDPAEFAKRNDEKVNPRHG